MNVTQEQKEVLDRLPSKRRDIADDLDITIRATRYRMDALEEKGYEFTRDSEGVWDVHDEPEDIERKDTEPWRIDSYSKAQATKEVHNELTEMEQEVKEALSKVEPVKSYHSTDSSSSTLFLPHSDAHIGAVVESRHGVDYYSADEARDSIEEYFDRGISAAKNRGDVEDVVVNINGDCLDGEGVYPGQRHEQEDNLRDQLRKAGNIYIEQLTKLAEEFQHVSVYCVPGNHGDISKRSTTNADMMLYDFVETAVAYSQYENIHIEKAGAGGFLNANIRGWNFHLRHGQDYLEHVGTSSGIRRALNWLSQYDFDVGIRSHYHSVKYEPVADETPVVMTGSPAPPSTFAESKAADGGKCGVYWFVTDDTPIDGFQPIRFC